MGYLKHVHKYGKLVRRSDRRGIASGWLNIILLVKRSPSWRKHGIVIGAGIVDMPRSIANDVDMRCQEYPPPPPFARY